MPPLGLGDKLIFNNLDKVALNLHDKFKIILEKVHFETNLLKSFRFFEGPKMISI